MAYYPMRCPHCMSRLTPDQILFGSKGAVESYQDGARSAKERFEGSNSDQLFDGFDTGDFDIAAGGNQEDAELPEKFTLQELEQYDSKSRKKYAAVTLTSEYEGRKDTGSASKNDLTVEVTYVRKKDQARLQTSDRYCPNCGKRLPDDLGKMPFYTIAVMGDTSSGKTVYLSILSHLMLKNRFTLPDNRFPYLTFHSMQCIPLIDCGNNEIVEFGEKICRTGELPATTTNSYTEPLILKLRYEAELGDVKGYKECILSLKDMRGEDLRNPNFMRGAYFRHVDGFLMVTDPTQVGDFSSMMDIPQQENSEWKLIAYLNNLLFSRMEHGHVTKPSVVVLGKSDLIWRYRMALQINESNAVIGNPYRSVYRDYFETMDKATREIMWQHADNFFQTLNSGFQSPVFTSASALGLVDIEEQKREGAESDAVRKRIKDPRKIAPVRMEEALMYLLMKIGFFPPYCEYYSYDKSGRMEQGILDWMNERFIWEEEAPVQTHQTHWTEPGNKPKEPPKEKGGFMGLFSLRRKRSE